MKRLIAAPPLAAALLVIALLLSVALPAAAEPTYTLTPDKEKLGQELKTPDGRTVLRYMTKRPAETKLTANSVCCLFPLNTPAGVRAVDFAPSDHPHHRGVFLAWHATDVGSRADFWGWGEMAPTEGRVIENRAVELAHADAKQAKFKVHNEWMADGKKAIDEHSEVVVREEGPAYVVDLTYKLTPTEKVTLERSAFGGFCVKARKDGKAEFAGPEDVSSLKPPHYLKPETDWPAADWYNYTIKLNEPAGEKKIEKIGVTVVDHPNNPPTTWHNLKGISMINPCIVAPAAVSFTKDKPLVLRYRLVVHDGPLQKELTEKLSKEFRGE